MKRSKGHIPWHQKKRTDKVTHYERTTLTDEERSKLFNVDNVDAMAGSNPPDSAWATVNEANPHKPLTLTTPPHSGNRLRGSYPAATYPNQPAALLQGPAHTCDGTPYIPPHLGGIGKNVTPHVPPHPRGTKQNATPHIPPHLRGIEQNGTFHLPPHLRDGCPNTQYSAPHQLSNSTEAVNTPLSLGTPQTPLWNNAPVTVPAWHLSPGSQAQQSPEISAGSVQTSSTEKGVISPEGKVPIQSPAPTTASQEDVFLAFLSRKSEEDAKDAQRRSLSKLAQKSPAEPALEPELTPEPAPEPAPEPVLPPVSPTHQIKPVEITTTHSIEDTDSFLSFLLRKEKDTHSNGKRYVAIGNSPQSGGKDTGGSYKGQNSATSQKDVKENTPLHTTFPHAIPQNNIPVDGTGNHPDKRDSFVPQTSLRISYAAAARVQVQEKTSIRDPLAAGNLNNATPKASHGWQDARLQDAKNIQKTLLSEIMVYNPPKADNLSLTENSLIQNGVQAPRARTEDSFCGKVSNTGVKFKENVRATQGHPAADDLILWDNVWRPPPQNWEADRYLMNLDYMPKYIREDWLPFVPKGPSVAVDTSTMGFRQGKLPVNDNMLGAEVIQPDCVPDIANSENEQKRLRQTAEMDAMILTKRRKKRGRKTDAHASIVEARYRTIAALELQPHPYAPAIPIYLRPTAITDAPGIRAIYNHYVKNSIIPEDQVEVSDEDITGIIELCNREKLPCIVAIKGKVPALPTQGRYGKASQSPQPRFETVIGFGWAQTYAYGIGGVREGRSRATAEIQFYTHHEYTRKGVGRSVLDRLIQSMSSSYAAKDGYDWANPKHDQTYNNGGPKLWHQLVIHLPVETKDDTTLPWLTPFLAKYWFDQEARLKRFARSTGASCEAKFLDLVIFAKTSSIEMEHSGFL